MIKKLRQNRKNKKGFTLVELIVVIVIILVLAAVLVPSVLKYVEKANQANTKADAASLLVQLQADAADAYAESGAFTPGDVLGKKYASGKASTDPGKDMYSCTIGTDANTMGEITEFSYGGTSYYMTWTKETGWSEPEKHKTANP